MSIEEELSGTVHRLISDLTNFADDLIKNLAANVSAISPSPVRVSVVPDVPTDTVGTLAAFPAPAPTPETTPETTAADDTGWDLGGVASEPAASLEPTPTPTPTPPPAA